MKYEHEYQPRMIPTKDRPKRPFSPWFNDELREIINKKNVIHNKLKKDRTNVLLIEQYKHEKKQVKSFIKISKKEYYLNKLTNNKNNSTAKWKVIKEIIPNQKNCQKGYIFDDMGTKAEEFNNFFANVGKKTKTMEKRQKQETLKAKKKRNFF